MFGLNRSIFFEQNHVESIIIASSFLFPISSLNPSVFAVHASSPG